MSSQQSTVELLNKTTVSQAQIEEDLGITADWISRFKRGAIVRPSPLLIECLYKYLLKEQKHRLRQNRKCEGL